MRHDNCSQSNWTNKQGSYKIQANTKPSSTGHYHNIWLVMNILISRGRNIDLTYLQKDLKSQNRPKQKLNCFYHCVVMWLVSLSFSREGWRISLEVYYSWAFLVLKAGVVSVWRRVCFALWEVTPHIYVSRKWCACLVNLWSDFSQNPGNLWDVSRSLTFVFIAFTSWSTTV